MSIAIVVLVVIISILAVIAVFATRIINRKKSNLKDPSRLKDRNRESILKDVNRRLAANPKDAAALNTLAELYFSDGKYTKAMRTYQLLLEQGGAAASMDEGTLNLRYGIAAMHCENWPEAYKALIIARGRDPENAEVNLNLGKIEYFRTNYPRAVSFLKRALQANAYDPETYKYLGLSYYKTKRFNAAASSLKQALGKLGTDPELLYAFAKCEYEGSRLDSAHNIFRQLRSDPKWGPSSALHSGSIFARKQDWEEAVADFQIGLKHENVDSELQLELKYHLAEAYSKIGNIDMALAFYNDIYMISPGYKDIEYRISQYKELNSNKNLQVYLLAPINEFITLIHKLAQAVFPKAKVDVLDVNFKRSDYIDLLANVVTQKRENLVLFRFMRVEGPVGELYVRDFYGQVQELHTKRGIYFAPGRFSVEAVQFVEARLIELWDREALLRILKTVDTIGI